jgi:hypothetical protein
LLTYPNHTKSALIVGSEYASIVNVVTNAENRMELFALAHHSGIFRAMAEHPLKRWALANNASSPKAEDTVARAALAMNAII